MNSVFFIKGVIFGFFIALPVGPIGILCIRRSLASGWRAGMLTGMGAATADALYGCVAGFGLAGISGLLVEQRIWIQLLGGLFLCWLGLRIFVSDTKETPVVISPASGVKNYASALFLTLSNPMTILSFTAVFAGMGLGKTGIGDTAPGWLVSGVFSGSMAWWIILSSISFMFKSGLKEWALKWINRISGGIITAFGMIAVFECLRGVIFRA